MSNGFGLMIESLVSALLLLTIGYCMLLNKRLKRLKADEQSLKATISELITATEIAERAIAGLKMTVRECDHTLGERLRTAERFSADIEKQIEAGGEVLDRLSRIAGAARGASEAPRSAVHNPAVQTPAVPKPAAPVAAPAAPDSRAMLAKAQAFAERARMRSNGMAA